MANTRFTGTLTTPINDGSIYKEDLNTTDAGHAVVTKLVAGDNVTLVSTGVDEGTGEVMINMDLPTGMSSIINAKSNNIEIGSRGTLNFIDTTEITIEVSDEPNSDQLNITPRLSGFTFGKLLHKPPTLAEHGITNAYTKTETDIAIQTGTQRLLIPREGLPTQKLIFDPIDDHFKLGPDGDLHQIVVLDNEGKIPKLQLRSANEAYDSIEEFPEEGTLDVLYIDRSNSRTYWYDPNPITEILDTDGITILRPAADPGYRYISPSVTSINGQLGDIVITPGFFDMYSKAEIKAMMGGDILMSPVLKGTPTTPTPSSSSGNLQIANTKYVDDALAAAPMGVRSVNNKTGHVAITATDLGVYSRTEVDSKLDPSILFNNLQLLGIPVTTTAALGTISTQLATTEFVANSIAAAPIGTRTVNGKSGNVVLTATDLSVYTRTEIDGKLDANILFNNVSLLGNPTTATAELGTISTGLATTEFVANALAAAPIGTRSVNGKTGNVVLTATELGVYSRTEVDAKLDVNTLFNNISLLGISVAPTAPLGTVTTQIATTEFVADALNAAPIGVRSVNGKTGNVTLTSTELGVYSRTEIDSKLDINTLFNNITLLGVSAAPTAALGTVTTQIATTEFVANALNAAPIGVRSVNGKTGNVTLTSTELGVYSRTEVDAKLDPNSLFNNVSLLGISVAPTAPLGTVTTQLATTEFVADALNAAPIGTRSVNGKTGNVVLTATELGVYSRTEVDAKVDPNVLFNNTELTGTPIAPTAEQGNATDQIATTSFISTALSNFPAKVYSINGKVGAVTIQANELNVYTKPEIDLKLDPNFLFTDTILAGVPTAPTAEENTGTDQIATTAYVDRGLSNIQVTVSSVNGKIGEVSLTKIDLGLGNVDNVSDADKPISDSTQSALDLKANSANPNFTGTVTGISKTMVGLGNVDNTSDLDKPVSTLMLAALNTKVPSMNADLAGIPTAPNALVTTNNTQIANTKFVHDAITSIGDIVNTINGNSGDIVLTKTMIGLSNVDNTADLDKPVSAFVRAALDEKASLDSPAFYGTVTGIDKNMVGLDQVDNTSDYSKPISNATLAALNLKASLASPTFTGTVQGITKTMVGLSDVDNTSDANKPLSSIQIEEFTKYQKKIDVNKPNGYVGLDANGKIPGNMFPTLTTNRVFVANSEEDQLTEPVEVADIAIRTDITNAAYIFMGGDHTLLTNWQQIQTTASISALVTSINGKTGAVSLTAADVSGLSSSATINTTNASNISSGTLAKERLPSLTGDVTMTTGTNIVTLNDVSGLTPGAYTKLIVNSKGLATSGYNPNTLNGYGITNAYTKVEVDSLISSSIVTFETLSGKPTTLSGYGILDTYTKVEVDNEITSHIPTFTTLSGKPTTLNGYGIVDSYTKTQVDDIILGISNYKKIVNSFAGPLKPITSTLKYYPEKDITLNYIYMYLSTVSDDAIIVDVKKNGTSIFTGTLPTLASNTFRSANIDLNISILKTDSITVDLLQATSGSDLIVSIIYT
jgi:hypothetical protein